MIERRYSAGSDGKETACNAGNLGLIPGLGRFPGEGKGCLLQYSGLETSMDCRVHGVTKSRTRLSNYNNAEVPGTDEGAGDAVVHATVFSP